MYQGMRGWSRAGAVLTALALVAVACTNETSTPPTTQAAPAAPTAATTTTTLPLTAPRLLTSFDLFGVDEVSRADDFVAMADGTVVFVGSSSAADTPPRATYWVTVDGRTFEAYELPEPGSATGVDAFGDDLAVLSCSENGIFGGLWVGRPGFLEKREYPHRLGCAAEVSYAGDNVAIRGSNGIFISVDGAQAWTRINTEGPTAASRGIAGPNGFLFTGWTGDGASTVHFVPGEGSRPIGEAGFGAIMRAGSALTVREQGAGLLYQLRDGEWQAEAVDLDSNNLVPDPAGALYEFDFTGTVKAPDGTTLAEAGEDGGPFEVAVTGDLLLGLAFDSWYRVEDGEWVSRSGPLFSEGSSFDISVGAATVGDTTVYASYGPSPTWLRRGDQIEQGPPLDIGLGPVGIGEHDGEFVVIGSTDAQALVTRSTDGVTWSRATELAPNVSVSLFVDSGDYMLVEAYDFAADEFITYLSADGLATLDRVASPDRFYDTVCLGAEFAVGQEFPFGGAPIERWTYATGSTQGLDVLNDGLACVSEGDSILMASWNREWLTVARVTADEVEPVWSYPVPTHERFSATMWGDGDAILLLLDRTAVGGDEFVELLYSDDGGESFRSTSLEGAGLGFSPVVSFDTESIWVAGSANGLPAFWKVERATAAAGTVLE